MNEAARGKQIAIYVGKCFRLFFHDQWWKTLLSAAIITLLISAVTASDMYQAYNSTRNGSFALICACIWIGIFNSIQSVCRERGIIKREHRTGLHMSSYIIAHLVFETVLSFVEALIVTLLIWLTNLSNFPSRGVFMPALLEFFITYFLIILSSDALGVMVSSLVHTPETAMTVMPFVLIIELVMSGFIFKLQGFSEKLSYITVSKWGLNALCTTANVNMMDNHIPDYMDSYLFRPGNLLGLWLILILFILIYGVIAIFSLEFIDRDKR